MSSKNTTFSGFKLVSFLGRPPAHPAFSSLCLFSDLCIRHLKPFIRLRGAFSADEDSLVANHKDLSIIHWLVFLRKTF